MTRTADTQHLELEIGGMTCAACAQRIEKKLNKLDGVSATVNYATEKASITGDAEVQDLIAAVEKTGYTAQLPTAPDEEPAGKSVAEKDLSQLRLRLVIAAVLSVPVVLVAMLPALQFPYWAWVSLVLSLPVVLWAGWPFHRSAALNARRGAATMDTLISLGTLAALIWSLYAMLFGHAGDPHLRHEFVLFAEPYWMSGESAGSANVYFEVATAVTSFLLLGRYFEKRSKARAGQALRSLLTMGAKEVSVLRPGASGAPEETRIPVKDLAVGDEFIVRPGEKIATDGVVISAVSYTHLTLPTNREV